ncbi:hypothetical protein RJ639_027556 [Escallonia herrerae]|uniref:B3 domain-containing protein n=1 Tax=Escallonia herrerae TaxID=1293975 RepID=A0AA88X2Y2_9ASTE|nr:hypothetical protein RJ639_027556 [Escallonia herrerae]
MLNKWWLTMDEVKDIEVGDDWSSLDVLTAVVAYDLLHQQREADGTTVSEKRDVSVASCTKRDEEYRLDPSLSHPVALDIYNEEQKFMERGQGDPLHCWKSAALDISKGDRILMGRKLQKEPILVTHKGDGLTKEDRMKKEKSLKSHVFEENNNKNSIIPVRNRNALKRARSQFSSSSESGGEVKASTKQKMKKKMKYDEDNHKRIRGTKNEIFEGLDQTAEIPIDVENKIIGMGGTDVKLVIQKKLFATDVRKSNNRLSIPVSKADKEFLTEDEKKFLGGHNGKNVEAMDVVLIDTLLNEHRVSFRRWDMKKNKGKCSSSYVLAQTWNDIREQNHLLQEQVIQLWAFRVDGALRFALVRLPTQVGMAAAEATAMQVAAVPQHHLILHLILMASPRFL